MPGSKYVVVNGLLNERDQWILAIDKQCYVLMCIHSGTLNAVFSLYRVADNNCPTFVSVVRNEM